MGSCFSTSKVSGSNSNTPSNTANNQRHFSSAAAKPQSATPSTATPGKQEGSRCNHRKTKENHKNQQQRQSQQVHKSGSKKPSGVIPCGNRTDFGYDKDFDARYTIGKLLGHGQFGYTYAAVDNSNGDRVAVKRIEKKKMVLPIAV